MSRGNPELAVAMGKRMTARRKELGLTQEQTAELAGMAYQQYNKAENGKCCLSSHSLQRVSAALQISADFLLFGETRDSQHDEIFNLLDRMTDGQLKLANEVLRCMVEFGEEEKRKG